MANERNEPVDPVLAAEPEAQVMMLKNRFAELRETKNKQNTATSNYAKIIDVLGSKYSVDQLDHFESSGTDDEAPESGRRSKRTSAARSIPEKDRAAFCEADEDGEGSTTDEWVEGSPGEEKAADEQESQQDSAPGKDGKPRRRSRILPEEDAAGRKKKRSKGRQWSIDDKNSKAPVSITEVLALRDTIGSLEARIRNQQVVIKGLNEKILKETYNNPLKFSPTDLLHACSMVPPPVGTGELTVAFVIIERDGLTDQNLPHAVVEGAHRNVQQILSKASCDFGGYCQDFADEGALSTWAFEEPEHAVEWGLTCQTLLGNVPRKSPASHLKLRIGVDKGCLEREADALTGETWFTGPAFSSAGDLAADAPVGVTNISIEVFASLGDRLPKLGEPHVREQPDSAYLYTKHNVPATPHVAKLPITPKSPNTFKKYIKSMREPAGMPLEWRPDDEKPGKNEWPPRGEVTVLCAVVDKYPIIENSMPAAAKAALQMCWNELRRVLKEKNGYESRADRNVFMAAFKSPADALAAALMAQQTALYLDWPEDIHQHPAAKTVNVGNTMVLKGLRMVMGLHTCNTRTRVDPLTGRSWYFGKEVVQAAAVTSVGLGGEIIATDKAVKLLQQARVEASRLMGNPEMHLVRPVVVDDFPEPVQCYEVSNVHLKHRRAYCGRGVARDASQSTEHTQKVQALERRIRQLEAENATKTQEVAELVEAFATKKTAPSVEQTPLFSRSHSMHTPFDSPMKMPLVEPASNLSTSLAHLPPAELASLDLEAYTRKMRQLHAWHAVPLRRWNTFVITGVAGAKRLSTLGAEYYHALGIMLDCMTAYAERFGGTRVAHSNDVNMYVFADVEKALKWACAVQLDLYRAKWSESVTDAPQSERVTDTAMNGLRVRMGVHAQLDGVTTGYDYLSPFPQLDGTAVRVASHAFKASRGGEIVATKDVVDRVSLSALKISPRETVELPPADCPNPSTTCMALFGVFPDALARRERSLLSSPEDHELCRPPNFTTARSTPPVAVAIRVHRQAKIRRYGEARRVLEELDALAENSAVELEGFPAQRLSHFSSDDEEQAACLWMFPSHTQALEWAMNLQRDAMAIVVPPVLACLECCQRVVEGSGKVFQGLRLCIGVAPLAADDFTFRAHPSPFGLGAKVDVHNDVPFDTAAVLCRAARGGETLAPAAFVQALPSQHLVDCVTSREFDMLTAAGAVAVHQVLPATLAARARHVPPFDFSFAEWKSHARWKRSAVRAKRRTTEACERHWIRMQDTITAGALAVGDGRSPSLVKKKNSRNASFRREPGATPVAGAAGGVGFLTQLDASVVTDMSPTRKGSTFDDVESLGTPGSPSAVRKRGFTRFRTELVEGYRAALADERKTEKKLRTLETFSMLAEDTYLHTAMALEYMGLSPRQRPRASQVTLKEMMREVAPSTQAQAPLDAAALVGAVMDVPMYQKKSTCIFEESEEDGGAEKVEECVRLTHKHVRMFSKLAQHYCDPLIDPAAEGLGDDEFMQSWLPDGAAEKGAAALGRYAKRPEASEDAGTPQLCSSMVGHCLALFKHLQTAVSSVHERQRRKRSARRKTSVRDEGATPRLPSIVDGAMTLGRRQSVSTSPGDRLCESGVSAASPRVSLGRRGSSARGNGVSPAAGRRASTFASPAHEAKVGDVAGIERAFSQDSSPHAHVGRRASFADGPSPAGTRRSHPGKPTKLPSLTTSPASPIAPSPAGNA
eukprot:TRINITY_DN19682_c0_g1_i1.p1 TRINITY_DN19682_c0_g1~~TRINITY_DN19682_c0_g1_i1.p1  ORF type:complete len:1721 (+),score=658.69 TRINITY_DN19682_c0_g1_i1:92-5254(+)